MARKINLNRQLLGLEDILFGEGTETQTRNGQEVLISKINIGNLPFNETQTLLEWLNSTDLTTLISSIPELLSIYENLPMLTELDPTEIIDAINKYLGLSVTINTLNPGEQATASYNAITGVLSLGIPKGDAGAQGPKGNSIESIIKTSGNSSPGTTDTYTITLTDLSTSTFTVYNGASGTGTGDMHTSTYDTNSNGIVDNAQMLSLDLTNTTPPNIGQIKWNQEEGTADLGLYGAVLQVGQEFLIKVRAGTNLTSGTVVMASGSTGNSGRIVVTAYDGTQANATRVVGILTEDIEAGADGFATIIGKVRNINTTGTLVGESWLDGDKLYVKPSDAGYLTKVEPIDTEIKMSVAYVINAHANGALYVRVTGFDENHYKNWVTNLLDTKVDKVPGKGLSTEDYTIIEKTKLNDIETNANNYSHPSTHDASMITESTTKRFVSDAEKTIWNSKQDQLVSNTNIKTVNGTSILGSGDITTSDATKLPLAGGTMTGAITAIRETKVAMAANNIDLATGNLFTKTITTATTLTVSNVLESGNANSFILELTNGGVGVITWWSGMKWEGGTAPTLTAAGVDILGFYSHDGGITWRGMVMAKDSK